MQIQRPHDKNHTRTDNRRNRTNNTQRRIRAPSILPNSMVLLPDTRDWQRGRQTPYIRHEDENPQHDRQRQVHKHGKLPQPPQNPIALEILHQGQQRGERRASGEQREHPDYEHVVGDHGFVAREADDLDADAFDDLLV